jgi:hypothetical protein
VALWTLPRLLIAVSGSDESPASAGLFCFLVKSSVAILTSSNDDGASSGGASDGDDDASPSICGASGDGAIPNDGGASPSDGHGPSALPRAKGFRPLHLM